MYTEADRLERLALLEDEAICSYIVGDGNQVLHLIPIKGSI